MFKYYVINVLNLVLCNIMYNIILIIQMVVSFSDWYENELIIYVRRFILKIHMPVHENFRIDAE